MLTIKNYFVLFCLVHAIELSAQTTPTVGLISHTAGSMDNGYVLFAPTSNTTTYLIDKCGRLMHSWPSAHNPSLAAYLLKDGSLLRPGVPVFGASTNQRVVEKIDWDGNVVWHAFVGDDTDIQHHDIQPLPNGNFLVLSNDIRDGSEATAAGRDTIYKNLYVNSEEITEYKPVGTDSTEIVWRWRAWDHLVQDYNPNLPNYMAIASHPELININYRDASGPEDWLHINAVKYNAELDQVLLCCRNFSEIWIIDHRTTTAEAASHTGGRYGKGGDLLYRWGNPAAYDLGLSSDKMLLGQHDAEWIPAGYPHAGSIIVLNNADPALPYRSSSVDIISPPVDSNGNYDASSLPFLPSAPAWKYVGNPPSSFRCIIGGGAQMLRNGNVLICNETNGHFFEIDSLGTNVWEYVCPVNALGPIQQGSTSAGGSAFRCTFYPGSDVPYAGSDNAGAPIEINPIGYTCNLNVTSVDEHRFTEIENTLFAYPNPATDQITIANGSLKGRVDIYNSLGQIVLHGINTSTFSTSGLRPGVYAVVFTDANTSSSKIFSVVH